MEIILFTLVGVMLYVASDAILKAIEKKQGRLLENRSIIFFGIIAVLALIIFNSLQYFGPKLGLLPASQQAAPTATQQPETPIEQQRPGAE